MKKSQWTEKKTASISFVEEKRGPGIPNLKRKLKFEDIAYTNGGNCESPRNKNEFCEEQLGQAEQSTPKYTENPGSRLSFC